MAVNTALPVDVMVGFVKFVVPVFQKEKVHFLPKKHDTFKKHLDFKLNSVLT